MKIKDIDFPEPIITALREERLVIFAGAGVSMSEPANLPKFSELASEIAEGTGKTKQKDESEDDESEDHFLGRLQNVKVNKRAAKIIKNYNPEPTTLHKNLLRLYPDASKVRIVTTNFDLLFEQAAKEIFDSKPRVFGSPALPSGKIFDDIVFDGIVHVHGSIDYPDEMVLTDKDFSQAYLIEGWPRRFLVDLFQNFTVLFIGYSHRDTIINYLSRGLPISEKKRFALIEPKYSKDWHGLGVELIEYSQYEKLDEGIQKLADTFNRGALEWKREIAEIVKNPPSLDQEQQDTIHYALKDEEKIHFFTNAARLPEWIDWLDKPDEKSASLPDWLDRLDKPDEAENSYLKCLFGPGDLNKKNRLLANWLADNFICQHTNDLFRLISKYGNRLNPEFWYILGREIGSAKQNELSTEDFSRWVTLLLATIPNNLWQASTPVLVKVGENCIERKIPSSFVQVFYALTKNQLQVKPHFFSLNQESILNKKFEIDISPVGEYWGLDALWNTEVREQLLDDIAQPLLKRLATRMEEQYFILQSWKKTGTTGDTLSIKRSAIEPHKQDRIPRANSVLIDAARDCLEWLMLHQTETTLQQCIELVKSEVPLLRRLAVHTLSKCEKLDANQKIDWILTYIGLHDLPARHEIFRAIRLAYVEASLDYRKKVIIAVLAYSWPNKEDSNTKGHTARQHFDWLAWLYDEASDCELLKRALEDIRKKYPAFEKRDYPDLLSWFKESKVDDLPSPWTAEQLLAMPVSEALSKLLPYLSSISFNKSRINTLNTIAESVKQNFEWGRDIAEALTRDKKWDNDIWHPLIRTWPEMELNEEQCHQLLNFLNNTKLYPHHAYDIARSLPPLAKKNPTLFSQANKIATELWDSNKQNRSSKEVPEENWDWSSITIDYLTDTLTDFWLYSLSRYQKKQDAESKAIRNKCILKLSDIIKDPTFAGRLGRRVLASQFHFLLAVDEKWTKENLLPLFSEDSNTEDFQIVWDGFIYRSYLNPAVAEVMEKPFLKAIQKISDIPDDKKERFIRLYTNMLRYFIPNPLEEWIPVLFQCGNTKVRCFFAHTIESLLRDIEDTQQQEWWESWLKTYWENRLDNVPAELKVEEIQCMLCWLPYLDSIFPEAVELAIKMEIPQTSLPSSQLDILVFILESSELPKKHPESVAKLLIYLGELKLPPSSWSKGKELIDKLLRSDIKSDLREKLEGLAARLNLS